MADTGRLVIGIVHLAVFLAVAEARIPGIYSGGPWQKAHATFYGGSDASGTMGTYMSIPCILLYPFVKAYQSHGLTEDFAR